MPQTTITKAVKHRRDTEALWTSNNPILLSGQLAFSTDVFYGSTNFQKFKVGNGVSNWVDLDYLTFAESDSRNRKLFAYQNTGVTITGTMAQTILYNVLIPANSMGLNDVLWVESIVYKIGSSGATYKMYMNTIPNSLAGAKLFGYVSPGSTTRCNAFHRRIANKNSQTVNNCYPTTTNAASEFTSSGLTIAGLNVDFTLNQYFSITATPGDEADIAGFDNIQLYINKP